MRTFLLIISVLFLSLATNAQNGINYKALIKDANGNALVSQGILVQFQILESGTLNVYQETHDTITDANGIVVVNIGEGTVNSGNFLTIDWGSADYFLNVQVDSGDGFVDLGTTQFKSVPYAMMAEKVKTLPITNLKYPNGFEGMESVTFDATYTVPAGKNLYVNNIRGYGLYNVTRAGIQYTFASGYYNSNNFNADQERTLVNPLLFKEGDVISYLNGVSNGFLINANTIEPLITNLKNNSYTVPQGKTFIILNYYTELPYALKINNKFIYSGFNNGAYVSPSDFTRYFYHSFVNPITANEGDVISVISGNSDTYINGYLMDKN